MAWSVVQSKRADTAGQATTVTVTLSTTPVTGHKIIAYVALGSGASQTISGVSDGSAAALTAVGAPTAAPSFSAGAIFCYDVPSTPVSSFTATTVGNCDISFLVQEVSGLASGTTGSLDATATHVTGSIGGAGSISGPAYTTAAASEYMVVFYCDDGNGSAETLPTGYTPDANNLNSSGDQDLVVGYKNSVGGSETTGPFIGTAPANYVIFALAFKLAAGVTNASVSVPALAATTVLPAPTISITVAGTVSVPPLAAQAVLPAPVVTSAHDLITPPPLAATVALPAPAVNTGGVVNATVLVSVLAVTTQLPAPAIAAGISVSVSVPALGATVGLFGVAAVSPLFLADPLAATTQLPPPTIQGKVSITVAVVPVTATAVLPAPVITFGFPGNTPVPVPPLAATVQLPAPAVVAGATVPISALAATTQLPAPSVFGGFVVPASLTPPVLAATAQLLAPIITIGSGVLLPALAVTVQFPAPQIVTVDVALPVVAYLFTPPTGNYVPPVPADKDGHNDPGWRLMKYHHPTPRGVNVFKLSDGTYPRDDVTGVWPTTPEVPNDALSSVWGVGSLSPIITPIDPEVIYVYYGGHSYLVDDAEAGRLTAAGYGPDLVGVTQDQIDVMTAQGWGFDTTGVLV